MAHRFDRAGRPAVEVEATQRGSRREAVGQGQRAGWRGQNVERRDRAVTPEGDQRLQRRRPVGSSQVGQGSNRLDPRAERVDLPAANESDGGGAGGRVGGIKQRAEPGQVARRPDVAASGGVGEQGQQASSAGTGGGGFQGEVEDQGQVVGAAKVGDQRPRPVLLVGADLARPERGDQRTDGVLRPDGFEGVDQLPRVTAVVEPPCRERGMPEGLQVAEGCPEGVIEGCIKRQVERPEGDLGGAGFGGMAERPDGFKPNSGVSVDDQRGEPGEWVVEPAEPVVDHADGRGAGLGAMSGEDPVEQVGGDDLQSLGGPQGFEPVVVDPGVGRVERGDPLAEWPLNR